MTKLVASEIRGFDALENKTDSIQCIANTAKQLGFVTGNGTILTYDKEEGVDYDLLVGKSYSVSLEDLTIELTEVLIAKPQQPKTSKQSPAAAKQASLMAKYQ